MVLVAVTQASSLDLREWQVRSSRLPFQRRNVSVVLIDHDVLAALGCPVLVTTNLPTRWPVGVIGLQAEVRATSSWGTGLNHTGCRLLSRISGPPWPTIGGEVTS